MDETTKKKYLKSKYKVKKWESEFKQCHGKIPSKTDIKNAPSHIKESYRTYWKLKTISLETSLVDMSFGDEDTMDGFSFPSGTCSQNESVICINNLEDSTLGFDSLTKTTITSTELSVECENFIGQTLVEKSSKTDGENVGHSIANSINTTTEKSIIKDKIAEQKVEDCEQDKKEDSVWGPHLSRPTADKMIEEKPKVEKPVLLSRYTAKLFAGASFKIRNPRKSFIRREKSTSDIFTSSSVLDDSLSSLLPDSNHSFSQPETVPNVNNKSNQEEKETATQDEDSQFLDLSSGKFKLVNTSVQQKQCQPVSILQRTLISNSFSKPLANRTVDKGWLDRLDRVTNVEVANKVNSSDSGIELGLTDSSVVSMEPKSSPLSIPNVQTNVESDEDDIVCDSDSESERSKSFSSFKSLTKTRSGDRLSISVSSGDLKRTSLNFSSFSRVNSDSQIPKIEKRTINQTDGEIQSSECKKVKVDGFSVENLNCLTEISKDMTIKNIVTSKTQTIDDGLMSRMARLVEIQNKQSKPNNKDMTPKSKEQKQKEILEKKVSSGKANENFVKINIKKKTYVRGKKTMTYQKYKKQKWKDMKKSASYEGGNGVYKCFKCGDIGHFAKNCMKACDQLLPLEDMDDQEESPFPTLQEAEEMAVEASKNMIVRRNANTLPVHIASEDTNILNSGPPQPADSDDIERLLTNTEPIFQTNEDGSIIDTPLTVLEALVQFGHQSWRPGQEVAVMRVLSGLSTLVTLSTGSGKSLCYQLPAYLYHTMQGRITLVVSPLVSLMEDQVVGVSPCLRVAFLNSTQSPAVRSTVLDQLRNNSLHALLVSPETLSQGDHISELLRCLPPVAFACIDEAHCISQWSHNFRPSYLTLCQVLREKFGVKTFLGLTATATQATIASVCEALGLRDIKYGVIRDTPLPDNLRLSVSCDRQREQALVALLKGERFSQCSSIIVYCTRRDECQRLAAYIRTCLQDISKEGVAKRGKLSWNAEAYHAGLTAARRRAVQKSFMSGKTRIVVATVAFGMGINKQDIQGIVHYNMPSTFERYVQEVGRAGRDGETAHCHLFLNTEGKDLCELRRFIYADSVERHTIRRLLQRVFVPCDCGDMCPGHEVAFSVVDTVAALDLPEENIETLLCYLELFARPRVRVCNRAYTRCRVLSYKGPKLIRQAAKECPPLAVAIAMEAQKGVSLDKMTKLEFPIFPVAAVIQWDSGVVKQQLKSLEWTKVDGQPRKSGLVVELFDLGFRVVAVGNLRGDQLDAALDSLTNRVDFQETQALRQLQATFTTMSQVSHKSVDECLDKVDDKRCEELKSTIRHYFTEESFLDKFHLGEVSLSNEDQIVMDVRNLVNCYRDVTFTGRAVARIFHGIASPNFPAQQWGRCRFWRAHLLEDFKELARLATRELIKMR